MKLFEYQHKFKENILKPKYRHHISNHKNKSVNETKIDRMVVAYSHPPNLGNLVSYRTFKAHICPPIHPLVISWSADQILPRLNSLWHVRIIPIINSLKLRTQSHGSSQVKDRCPLRSTKLYHDINHIYIIKQAFILTHNY